MGQAEVIKLLGKNKKWKTAEEIADKLKIDGRVVRRALMVLYRYNEVLRKKCKDSTHFKYIYKIIWKLNLVRN